MPGEVKFDIEDLELLTSVLEVIPNLATVAHATKLVRRRLQFPIGKREELLPVFDGKKGVRLGDRDITLAQIEQFLPERFFPIESERDLVCKLLIAFQIGDIYHYEELTRKAKPDDMPVELLPGPAYHPGGYMRLRRSRKEEQ